METSRRPFQGVINILSFNRHFYVMGISALALIITSHLIFHWSTSLMWFIVLAFIYGLIMPLIVSAYVYDFSGYYDFNWLKKMTIPDSGSNQMVNINAGFDETSYIIKDLFPQSDLKVFDFYNAERHTEVAIVRARKVSLVYPDTRQIASNHIPLDDQSTDLVFLLSAAHEIRSPQEKVAFLSECRRVCKPTAKVIMVEHLRDFPNFLAFTVGFTHFFSRKAWVKAFKESGFTGINETKFTPFMSVFNCHP
jgi:SAM-dependent methyltransferase